MLTDAEKQALLALARRTLEALRAGGAQFFVELVQSTGLDAAELAPVHRWQALLHLGRLARRSGQVERARESYGRSRELLDQLSQTLGDKVNGEFFWADQDRAEVLRETNPSG